MAGIGFRKGIEVSARGGKTDITRMAQRAGTPLSYVGSSGQILSTGGGVTGQQRFGGGTSAPAAAPAAGGGGGGFADMYQQALERLSTGGLSLEASLADIEAGKREAIGAGEQNLVSAGLAGTTVMGSVPLAAEKGAALSRLKARGTAEEKYLTTLISFANLAAQAEESRLGREASMQRLQTQIGAQERLAGADRMMAGSSVYIPESERHTRAYTYGASLTPDVQRGETSMGPSSTAYSNQFPSLYGGRVEEPVPNWM